MIYFKKQLTFYGFFIIITYHKKGDNMIKSLFLLKSQLLKNKIMVQCVKGKAKIVEKLSR